MNTFYSNQELKAQKISRNTVTSLKSPSCLFDEPPQSSAPYIDNDVKSFHNGLRKYDFEPGSCTLKGVVDPNYPRFHHMAHTLVDDYRNSSFDCFTEQSENDFKFNGSTESIKKNFSSSQSDIVSYQGLNQDDKKQKKYLTYDQIKKTLKYPDILPDNSTKHREIMQNQHCPDLLGHIKGRNEEKCSKEILNGLKLDSLKKYKSKKGDVENDHITFVPANIIGDFESEVEHELRLIVNGYKKLAAPIDNNVSCTEKQGKKVNDAELSGTYDNIFCEVNQTESETKEQASLECLSKFSEYNNLPHNHATNTAKLEKLKFNKTPFDERQLPPIEIDYKKCRLRSFPKKTKKLFDLGSESSCTKIDRSTRINLQKKKKSLHSICIENCENKQNITSHKEPFDDNYELGSQHSIYLQSSTWSKHLHTAASQSSNLLSGYGLDLFDAYKVDGNFNLESIQTHLLLVKEIEKKRLTSRAEIHKRLAFGHNGEIKNEGADGLNANYPQKTLCKDGRNQHLWEIQSDHESCSSDSETCPKLTKYSAQDHHNLYNHTPRKTITENEKFGVQKYLSENNYNSQILFWNGNEDQRVHFFTKHAKLQIDVKIALVQAKDMAHMKMEIYKASRESPVTKIIKDSIRAAGVLLSNTKRRVSRQMLTELKISQMRIILDQLVIRTEYLNKELMDELMIRDDLNNQQDLIMNKIFEVTELVFKNENKLEKAS